jgi:isoquinoline 1-oxidoreductase
MDEMAAGLGVDPLAFRRKHLRDERIAGVLDAATTTFRWSSRKRASGRGYGLACGTEKGGYVATCAEVLIDGRDVRVTRVVAAFECGAIVNPDGLKNQVEGAVVQGLGGALFEAIAFEDGRIVNGASRLPRAAVPRRAGIATVLRDGVVAQVEVGPALVV